jgi:hypothetical protein
MTHSSSVLFAKVALRGFQLLCVLLVLVGLSNYNGMVDAIDAWAKGAISLADLCWKILPVTGPLIPAIGLIVGSQLLLRSMTPSPNSVSEPWLANPMWAAKHIRLSNRGLFWGVAIGWLLFAGIVVPFAIATNKTPFVVLSGIIGLFLLLLTRVFWLNRKWNIAELRMTAVPGVVGGPFSGVAILQEAFPAGTAFDVCLKCEQTKTYKPTSGSGGSTTKTDTIWSATNSIDKQLPADGPNRTLIPFGFAVPFDCEPTSTSNNPSQTINRWRLVVKQKDKVGFGGAVFTVPIFVTPESRADFKFDNDLFEQFEQEVDIDAVLARVQVMNVEGTRPGRQLLFRYWDAQGVYSISLLSFICTSIIVAFFWFLPNLLGATFASIFPGIVMFASMTVLVDMLLWGSRVEISPSKLRCESGWRGLRKTLETDRPSLVEFRSVVDFHKESGESYRVDMCLPEHHRAGVVFGAAELTVVKQLKGRADAEAVARWLKSQLAI